MLKASLFAVLMAAPAMAQAPCAPLDQMAETLSVEYGESIASVGKVASGELMVLFVNPRTGTWSIAFYSDGQACLRAAGTGYQGAKGEGA